MVGTDNPVEKSSNNERNLGKSRGWLNWLSRGMLGAGGTDDSSQFSGVVSDDVIKVLLPIYMVEYITMYCEVWCIVYYTQFLRKFHSTHFYLSV